MDYPGFKPKKKIEKNSKGKKKFFKLFVFQYIKPL